MAKADTDFSFDSFRSLLNEFSFYKLNDAEFTATYLLLHFTHRHGTQWLSGPRQPQIKGHSTECLQRLESLGFVINRKLRERLTGIESIADLWRQYYFRGVVLDSHEGMVGWLDRKYPLVLKFEIPSASEMLDWQCRGQRVVTVLPKVEDQFIPYGRHRDACAFTLHDLEHAHKFFGSSFRGQVCFFRALHETQFTNWLDDIQFLQDFDYLRSDMNSHPVHLTKYMKAIVLNAEIRRSGRRDPPLDDFWRDLFGRWKMPIATIAAALTLNQPDAETTAAQTAVYDFFAESVDIFAARNETWAHDGNALPQLHLSRSTTKRA